MRTKAIGYIRVSTEEQADKGVSLDHQKEKIRAYATLHDMELDQIIEDRGFSARTIASRPGALNLLGIAAAGETEAIIVYKLDRLFRNAAEALTVSQDMDKYGVSLHSVTEKLDTSSAMGKFYFTIAAAFAEMERNLIGERTRDALRHKKAAGLVYNHVPYGYRAEGGILVVDMVEQGRIEKMQEMRKGGWSYAAIADALNAEGIPAKKGGKWHAASVQNVLELAEQKVPPS